MENEKKNSGMLVGILVGLVIALLIVVCLFATGTIEFKKTETTDNKQLEDSNNINEIDSALANNLYEMLGIVDGKDCLNYFLSNNNYRDNAKQIFGLYALYNNLNTNHYNDDSCNEDCKKALSCGECSSIKKINADRITKLYNLNNLKFDELPGFNDEYAYTNGIPAPICHYELTHDTSIQYSSSDSIRIVDKQVVTDYSYDHQQVNNKKNQIVNYDLKKGSDGNYYLNQVVVE